MPEFDRRCRVVPTRSTGSMVLTSPVLSSNQPGRRTTGGCDRRLLLRGTLGAVIAGTMPGLLAGCDLPGRKPEADLEPDPLAGLLTDTVELARQYADAADALAEFSAVLAPIAAAHRAHAEELSRITGIALSRPTPDPGTTPSGSDVGVPGTPPTATPPTGSMPPPVPPLDPAATLAALRAAEEAAGAAAADACRAAPAERAAVLGSIAAARACHLEVLP
jgi:hypothetical protein